MDRWLNFLQVGLGIGLVIFVHELGHFLAARWCGVRVKTFSLGFGPRLFGWTRGGTSYQIAAVPLGGFVSMAGEEPSEERAPLPDELPAKSVGQRFLIYSGGVIMNMVFALVVFPILFLVGVPFDTPVVGGTVPGSAAWHASLPTGTRIERVEGRRVLSLHDVATAVAIGSTGAVELEIREPGASATRTIELEPRGGGPLGMRTLGIEPAVDPEFRVTVAEGGAAHSAGVRSGDRLLDVRGEGPETLGELPLLDRLQFASLGGGTIHAEFERADGSRFAAEIAPAGAEEDSGGARRPKMLGVQPPLRVLDAIRDSAHTRGLPLAVDDEVLAVNGRPLQRPYDFERHICAAAAAGETLRFDVERDGARLTLDGPRLDRLAALALAADLAWTQDAEDAEVVVLPGSAAAEAGLVDDDRIVRIDGMPVRSFADITAASKKAAGSARSLAIVVERRDGEARRTVELQAQPRPLDTGGDYGFGPRGDTYVFQAAGPLQAIGVGALASWRFLQDTWLTLKSWILGRVSGKAFGGIITIAVVADSSAQAGLAKLFFFLCLLSVNLAFLNVLPIPVLDGGHLFFLLIEKLKGSPVSVRVLSYSQIVGLVVILSLMVYVLHNDVMRFFFQRG